MPPSNELMNPPPHRPHRVSVLFLMVLGLVLLAGVSPVVAQTTTVAERRDFEAARVSLDDGQYPFAEKLLAAFLVENPASPLIPDATLLLARARYHQQKWDEALAVLQPGLPTAGTLSDQYQYWVAEILYAQGRMDEAATAYAEVISKHPDSSIVLSAAFRQAYLAYQKQQLAKTVELLADVNGAFEKSRVKDPAATPSIMGLLLLADAQFSLGQFADAETSLAKLPPANLNAMQAWRQASLLARVYFATDRANAALELMPGVLELAANTKSAERIAESHSLKAGILESSGRKAEALAAYEPNLNPEVAGQWRREALVKTVELALQTGGAEEALSKVELLSTRNLDDLARDLVQLTLGELRLKQFYALPYDQRIPGGSYSAAASNLLAAAQVHFTNVINEFTNSPYLGKTWMNRGWCDWQLQRWPEAAQAFSVAAQRLTPGRDQAIATFKLGDAQFNMKQYTNALATYQRVITDYGEQPAIKEELLDQVYYQIIQAGVAANDLDAAVPAMQALIALFPGSFYADRSLLLVGQALNDFRNPAGSRKVFEEFSNRFKGSSLEPEVQLAIARTYELEGNWPAAVAIYQAWITNHTNHASLPTAEFGLAWGWYQSGNQTNAMITFTNFVSRHTNDALTPKALQWVGDQYFSQQDYLQAERYYQQLYQSTNWPATRLTYEAAVMAGRAALSRQGYAHARGYLTNMLNNPSCPPDVFAHGLFAFGDVLLAEPSQNPNQMIEARSAFELLVQKHQNSPYVPAAWGRIGDCNFQLKLYNDATNAYLKCLTQPNASVSDRSQAEVKLGQTLEKSAQATPEQADALLQRAMVHYLNVFYEQNLNAELKEQPDLFWLKRAGLNAAQLAESRRQYDQAARLYRRLKEMLPQLGEFLDQRIRQQEELLRKQAG